MGYLHGAMIEGHRPCFQKTLINHFGKPSCRDDRKMKRDTCFQQRGKRRKAEVPDLERSGVRFVLLKISFPCSIQGHLPSVST